MQYLRLPINDFKPTAGYKNAYYKSQWKYTHFGVDCVSKNKNYALYGLGDGIVKAAGLDGLNGKTTGTGSGCGYVLIIVYEDVYNRATKKSQNITCTYMHMREMPKVKVGDKVTTKTLLGYYGNTGANTTGPHLHIQFDTDTKYYQYCSGVSSAGHNILKHGTTDSTVNPINVLFRDTNQVIYTYTSKWYNRIDFLRIEDIPKSTNSTTGRVIIG